MITSEHCRILGPFCPAVIRAALAELVAGVVRQNPLNNYKKEIQ